MLVWLLKNYSRCGENDVSSACLTYVGALHGGGPAGFHDKTPAHERSLNIQQKNALASFLLSRRGPQGVCTLH